MTREGAIQEITNRITEFYRPERVYLFDSVARGDATPDSDLDFCVVLPDDAPEELMRSHEIHKRLRDLDGLDYSRDIIPWRKADFDGCAAYVVVSLPAIIIREGRLLYDDRRAIA